MTHFMRSRRRRFYCLRFLFSIYFLTEATLNKGKANEVHNH